MIKKIEKPSFYKICLTFFASFALFVPQKSFAFPIYAQQAYESPREANGRIVCANCHLAQKPTEFEAPTSVLPDSVFETIVKIPYDTDETQSLSARTGSVRKRKPGTSVTVGRASYVVG